MNNMRVIEEKKLTSKGIIKKTLISLSALIFMSNASSAERVTLKFAKPSSSYYQMSVQLAELLKNHDISATVEESQGSVQNVNEAVIRHGNYIFTTPYGLVDNAQKGKQPFRKNSKFSDIRSLFPAPSLMMHYVFSENVKASGFSDLSNEKILIGKGTFSAREAKKTFSNFSLNDLSLIEVEMSSAVDAIKNKKIDGFVTANPWPTPSVMELSTSSKIKLLSMTDEEVKKTGREKAIIPKKAYPGLLGDVTTTSLPVTIWTTTKMSDDVAYLVTSLFWENKEKLEKTNAYWAGVNKDYLKEMKGELHPGAKKYYVEKGWLEN